ncbi:hypothetical protein QCD70_11000 [Agreia sp. PsM10]|uniref:hypothetical protein n=1 Tax=Agreia sp. PsM10 TaxID=3030533 RepID=UPI00263A940A|nr:hypothetical protein [Agreia sp. PsM10]MDN4640772.1 hypothetical protein [Agreia sp. PsM10]
MMTTTTPTTETATVASSLRKLYFVRFAFAVVWAVLVFVTAPSAGAALGIATVALLVLYPLFDVAAAVVDSRTNRGTGATPLLYINMALSLLAAIGLAIASASGTPAVLVVWGVWAITAGAVQLIVALRRRALGGQWALILSGGLSVLAGTAIASMAGGASASVGTVGGYATLGGIFFLVSALRLGRAAKGL